MRCFPSNCTSRSETARSPAAITMSFSFLKTSPGFPLRSTIDAEKIFSFRFFVRARDFRERARPWIECANLSFDQFRRLRPIDAAMLAI